MSKSENWVITLQPHRSLSPRGFKILMIAIAAINLVIGSMFYAIGAWPIVGFLGLDVALIWWAFNRNYASSGSFEKIIAQDDALTLLRVGRDGSVSDTVFNRRWVKVEIEHDVARELTGRLLLRSHGIEHEVAAFLGADERLSLARALRRAI
jgi:uncharacterized membrane protein